MQTREKSREEKKKFLSATVTFFELLRYLVRSVRSGKKKIFDAVNRRLFSYFLYRDGSNQEYLNAGVKTK